MATGASEIVLLPGLDGTGDLFERVAPFLAEELAVRIIRYPEDPNLGYAGYAELVRHEIGSRQVFLLGESFSGPVAIRVAKQLGRQIRGLVLVATFLKAPQPAWVIRIAARLNPEATPVKLRDAILMGQFGDRVLSEKVGEIVRALPRAVRAARLRALAEVDVSPDFAELRCPILVLHGRNDWLVPVRPMQMAVSNVGGARMTVIPGPHMLLQTQASVAAGEIVFFTKSSEDIRYEA